MLSVTDLYSAADSVQGHPFVTPRIQRPLPAGCTGSDFWVKHKNHLSAGTFKVRGGIVLADRQFREGNGQGLIFATHGNHGQSLAWAGS